MEKANIGDAPAFLNLNDKAMWVLGYNEAVQLIAKASQSVEQAQEIKRLRVVMAALIANPTSRLTKNIARAALKETK